MQKSDFNDKVTAERVGELNTRIESSAATILSLEAKIRDLSKTDVSVSELLRQVRETAEAELRKYQVESEDQYNRNVSVILAGFFGSSVCPLSSFMLFLALLLFLLLVCLFDCSGFFSP